MTASDDLLRRLESDEELARLPVLHRDFDIKRRDPVEELAMANGRPLTPVAGDGAGGTYFLCGEQGEPDRPVLFADSEGRAVLMAASLVEAVELIVQFPYWHDLPYGHDPGELEAEYRDDDEDFDAARAETIAVLGLSPLTPGEALTRLRAAVALNQFRRGHGFLPGFRAVIDAELPGISRALQDAGGLRTNFLRDLLPAALTGGWRDGDERFEMVTGRRPMVEAVLAAAAESAPGVEVRRGTSVTGLVTGASALSGVPHVTGVRTKAGELILAELVVDTSGRRSALPDWLEDIGARRPAEELEESGFVYYGRHFRSADGSVPAMIALPVTFWGSVSSVTLPADNATWSVSIVTSSKDTALRSLRETDRWEAFVRGLPPVAHWLDGIPIDDGVQVMARLEDRYRGFVVDGNPVATGVVAVADSWACSNPANGRGASIGMLHAVTLRDQLRAAGPDDPAAFAEAFHTATAETVEPWYRATLTGDRHRLGEIEAGIRSAAYHSADSAYQLAKALAAAGRTDPDCLRASLDIGSVLRPPEEVFARPGLRDKIFELGSGWREEQQSGPTREQLLALASAQ